MILTFAKVHRQKRERGQAYVPTWLFAGSYILIWSATGIIAYVAAIAGDELASRSAWVMDNAGRIGGGLIVLAGLYQLSPLKDKCLGKCRNPMSFILNSWRDGYGGSFRMGAEHAVYCLGCCWLLFAILFPLGMMNIAVLAVITLLIFAEKSLAHGRRIALAAGGAMLIYGAVVIAHPAALPMTMSGHGEMEMSGEMESGEMEMGGDMAPSGGMD
jgi:predicted metal-binding membrane protein